MEVRAVGYLLDVPSLYQYASSYLINGIICVDAGSIGFWATPEHQRQVRQVLLTHSHIDHITSLPSLLENLYDPEVEPVVLHATEATLAVLRDHIFNGLVWPNFLDLKPGGRPFARISIVTPGQEFTVEGLRVLPVSVNHQVPTVGYIVSDGFSTVIFGADSAPTADIWNAAKDFPAPYSVFIEASFPNRMRDLAELSQHLTPAMVHTEYAKMPLESEVFVVHVKPRFRDEVAVELEALSIPGLIITACDGVYSV